MKTIWKYRLRFVEVQDIELPAGAQILSVQEQQGFVCLWALFDKSEARVAKVRIMQVGTGNDIPDGFLDAALFIGTVQTGAFVWHVFAVQIGEKAKAPQWAFDAEHESLRSPNG